MNLNNAIDKFLTGCESELGLSDKTTRAYAYDLGQFGDFMESKDLDKIITEDIKRYLVYLDEAQHLKDSTIRRKIMTLKAFFGFFVTRKGLSATPLTTIDHKYKITKSLPKILNANDVQRLLEFIDEDVERLRQLLRPGCGRKVRLHYENAIRDRSIIEVLFSTAMRIGELSELNLEHVDLESRTLHVLGRGNRNRILQVEAEKTTSSVKEYLRIRENLKGDPSALYLNRFGGRLSIFAIENLFERIRKSAGIRRRVTPHALRHTMATMMLNSGKDLREIQHILGHSSVVTTQIYSEVAPRRQRKVLSKFNAEDRLSVKVLSEQPVRRLKTIRRPKKSKQPE
jgi:integrase/recombinase XerC/integrase/recombinase XerD